MVEVVGKMDQESLVPKWGITGHKRLPFGFLVNICLSWKKFFPFLMSLSHVCLCHK